CVRCVYIFFSSRRRHTRFSRDWSSDVCSSDLAFCEAITEIEREAAPADAVDDDALLLKLDPADSADAVMRDFDRLEPCGEGNPRPKLVVDAHLLQAREVKGGHLKLRVDCGQGGTRSEEHTSELQSRENLVCRLLLEKKN